MKDLVRMIIAKSLLPALAFAIPLVVYTVTLAPSVTLEDSGEYISVAETLGLAHPPGVPLWCLLAHGMTKVPVGTVAQRTNYFSALCSAFASLFLFLWIRQFSLRWETALSAAGISAFSRCIWGQSVVTEVYTLNLAFLSLCLLLVERWRETKRPAWLMSAALAGGLGSANHLLLILLSPVVIARALWGRFREVVPARTSLGCVLCLVCGLSVYLYLPIRSAQSPPIAWGKVDSFGAFYDYVSRKVYSEWDMGTLYDAACFLWAFARHLPWEQGGILVLFAAPGMVRLWRKNRVLLAILLGIVVLNVPVLLLHGRSVFTPTSEYINRLYYLPATSALAVCTATGWSAAVERLFHLSRDEFPPFLAKALVLSSTLFPLALNWNACDRSEYWIAREYAQNLVKSLPKDGAVFPLTNNEGFLLTYMRFVEKDPRAWLLDQRFGWDGKRPPKAVYTAWDVGRSAVFPLHQILPEFAEVETVPESILYRVIKEPERKGLSRFERIREVDYSIDCRPAGFPDMSPFERMIFASYSAFYAGLGAKRFQEGREEAAEEAWRLAEELNPPDSYCCYLLGSIYQEMGVRSPGEIRRWFEDSLALFDLCYDPLDTRFYAIAREMVEEKLKGLAR
jgi:hypothetical protein